MDMLYLGIFEWGEHEFNKELYQETWKYKDTWAKIFPWEGKTAEIQLLNLLNFQFKKNK